MYILVVRKLLKKLQRYIFAEMYTFVIDGNIRKYFLIVEREKVLYELDRRIKVSGTRYNPCFFWLVAVNALFGPIRSKNSKNNTRNNIKQFRPLLLIWLQVSLQVYMTFVKLYSWTKRCYRQLRAYDIHCLCRIKFFVVFLYIFIFLVYYYALYLMRFQNHFSLYNYSIPSWYLIIWAIQTAIESPNDSQWKSP